MNKDKIILLGLSALISGVAVLGLLDMKNVYAHGIYTLSEEDSLIETNQKQEKYYLVLDDSLLPVDKKTYESLEWGTDYRIKYVWNGLIGKGYGDILVLEKYENTENQKESLH